MKSYKNKALNPEEMRRRREEEGIQLRKQKREQQVTVTLSSLCTALTQPGLCCCLTGIFKDLCIKVRWQSSYFFPVLTNILLFSFSLYPVQSTQLVSRAFQALSPWGIGGFCSQILVGKGVFGLVGEWDCFPEAGSTSGSMGCT